MINSFNHLSYEERLRLLGLYILEQRRLKRISAGWSKEGEGTRLFSVVSNGRTRAVGTD